MAWQGLFCRATNLVGNYFSLNNRLPQLIHIAGVRQKALDALKELNVPEKPKKPLTPYMKYVQERRASLLKEYPHWKVTQVAVQCASEWKQLDASTRAKYEIPYKRDMEHYTANYLKYVQGLTKEQKAAISEFNQEKKKLKVRRELKKKLREEEKPKKPVAAYALYVLERAKAQPEKSYMELLKELKEEWQALPEGEKNGFVQRARRAKEQFDKDLIEWEQKMIREGKSELVRKNTLIASHPKAK